MLFWDPHAPGARVERPWTARASPEKVSTAANSNEYAAHQINPTYTQPHTRF